MRYFLFLCLAGLSLHGQTYTSHWPSQSNGNGGFFSPHGLEIRQDGIYLKINPYNGVYGGMNGGVVSFLGSYSYLPDQTVVSDGSGGWESETTDFHLILKNTGTGGGGSSSSGSVTLSGDWVRGNGVVYEISEIDDQGWYFMADRSNGGYSELYFRFADVTNTDVTVGWKNPNTGLINESAGTQAHYSEDDEYKRLDLDFPNGQAAWLQPVNPNQGIVFEGGEIDENSTSEEILEHLTGQFNQLGSVANSISSKLDLLDSDDDVPTLEQIRDILMNQQLAAAHGGNVVQGVRNESGEFVQLEDRIKENLPVDESKALAEASENEHKGTLENLFVDHDAQVKTALLAPLESSQGIGAMIVPKPVLANGQFTTESTDLFGGFMDFGMPSVEQLAGWVRLVLVIVTIWWYISHMKWTAQNYLELHIKATWTSPITNYGGALGGAINGPIKIGHTVFLLGSVGLAIAALVAGMTFPDGSDPTAELTQTMSLVSSGAGTIADSNADILSTTWGFVKDFIPLATMITLITYAWVTRFGIMVYLYFTVSTSRAMS